MWFDLVDLFTVFLWPHDMEGGLWGLATLLIDDRIDLVMVACSTYTGRVFFKRLLKTCTIELSLLLIECGDHGVLISFPCLELLGQLFNLFLVPMGFSFLSIALSLWDLSLSELLSTFPIPDWSVTWLGHYLPTISPPRCLALLLFPSLNLLSFYMKYKS